MAKPARALSLFARRNPNFFSVAAASALFAVCLAAAGTAARAQKAETAAASTLTVVDPYLMTIPANHQLTVSAVITSAAGGKANAKGIVADGTSAAIAVFKTASSKNVTFSVTNGGKVAKYNPAFLIAVSSLGTSSVVITPTKSGTSYYALALVTSGVAPDAEHGVDTTVSAESAGATKATTFAMVTLPTPIVLIHGLWGDETSLASTEGYLKVTPAFTNNRNLVTAICYSDYLAFDATADSLPGHGTGCEMTSAQALNQYFASTLYKELDANHWVGGRVDAVVHSMGGLVARHYTAVAGYKSLRNRMLGAFRNVVTLDTPETGSALATYLDETAYKRSYQGSSFTEALLWEGFCGSTSSSTTIETCFDANGLPLSYPGMALSTGAVWSLIPAGHSVTSAPPADIFNTSHGSWFAIASDFKDGDKPPALLRDLMNAVTAATYPSGQTAPTLTTILGTPDSDVIVTVAGQEATAPAAHIKEFKDLEHTPAPSEGKLLFPSDSNNSVVESAAVNAQVALWLGLQSSATPAVDGIVNRETDESRATESGRPAIQPRFMAGGRLSVAAPQHAVGLGQPLRITIRSTGPAIAAVNVVEFRPESRREIPSDWVNGGHARIVREEGNSDELELVPLDLGRLGVRVQAVFADGGFAQRDFELEVVPTQRNLERFDLDKGFHSMALVLEDRDEDRQAFLAPVVKYDSLARPIYLSSSEQLNLTIEQPEDDPVIQVDPNGLVHALRPGKALITGDFDGVQDSIEVEVYTKDDAPAGYRRNQD